MHNSELFEKNGYVLLDGFLDPIAVSTVSQYFENKIRRGEWKEGLGGPRDSTKYGYYADPLTEVILKEYKPIVEEAIGKKLLPSYTYSRVYQAGEQLEIHTDRPACEISVTVSVAYAGEPNAIGMQYENNPPAEYVLSPGSAIIYKGCEVKHWRKPLEQGQLVVQFMLHYVIEDGKNSDYVFDQRKSLGLPSR